MQEYNGHLKPRKGQYLKGKLQQYSCALSNDADNNYCNHTLYPHANKTFEIKEHSLFFSAQNSD